MTSRWVLSTAVLAAVAAAWLSTACAQFPGQQERPRVEIKPDAKLDAPTVDAKKNAFTIPAAFWNQHMTTWVEVAMCGRPSEFLHETIVSVFTTRKKLIDAARLVGFRDADHWVSNVADFPRVRGDRAMVLLEVEMGGKKEIFPLDELLGYQGWGVTIGPFGWMFKGEPDRAPEPAGEAAEPGGVPKNDARNDILNDDPQMALQFKGIQHLSRSFMDHPLCYDKWIYPNARYERIFTVAPKTLDVPKTVTTMPAPNGADVEKPDDDRTRIVKFWAKMYDSNGEIKVTMSITRVSDEEFLTQMATHWHDAAYAAYIRERLPIARQIDADKAELEKHVLAVRALLKKGMPHEDVLASDDFAHVALLSAKVEKGYTALDAAWTKWSATHPVYDTAPGDNRMLEELKERLALWDEHMTDWKDRAAYLETAEQARFDLRPFKGKEKDKAAEVQVLRGKELTARSHASLLEGKHVLRYWAYEDGRLTPDETRTAWIRNIKTQLELIRAQQELAKIGITLGEAMQKDDKPAMEEHKPKYAKSILRVSIADLQARLADVEFNMDKYEESDPARVPFKTEQEEILKQLKMLGVTTQPATQESK